MNYLNLTHENSSSFVLRFPLSKDPFTRSPIPMVTIVKINNL